MKAFFIIFLIGLLQGFTGKAQLVAEDARSGSSIPMNASSLSVNLSEAALSVNWNNFRNLAIEKPKQLIWGIDARGSNAEGLSVLLDGGAITPRSRFSGFLGFRKNYQTSTFELLKRIKEIQASEDFPNEAAINTIKQLTQRVKDTRKAQPTKILTVYINTGLNTENFKQYRDLESLPVAERFSNVDFKGAFVFLGVNYEYGPRWTLGLAAGIERGNTLDSLLSRDYRVTQIISAGNAQLYSETKYYAYTGDFMIYNRMNFKTDALYFAKVSEEYRAVWNTFFTRFYLPLRAHQVNSLVQAGSAVNFYKSEGKFAGGIYAQSNDLFNSTRSGKSFTERMSIGIVAKYAFGSIMTRDFIK